ncbi:tRNA (cytosine-C5-)-methyltransferase SCDLUD_001597 [Saccharomycodes ludwigii]|uniref:tRNA (cytosine-C5-)-methyltransferase n=1 Tax=Saccharomycodes ludwigii TaxID=36035 RepID=UPI001E8C9803|nr:hypothetical protein SCDLUD_001597 [Saccharomycodes ludwigii]KAH3901815.1 hypothetical protein SCDLUD_001597 [Saccharomycodes ludwigii]
MARRKGNNRKKTFGARDDRNNGEWTEIKKENEKWETYYKAQKFIPEKDWDFFKKTCQTQLPLTFRITGNRKHANEILDIFKTKHLPQLGNVEFEGEIIKPPVNLPWYPDNLAWQLDVSKTVIRKNEQFSKTQRFLVLETSAGNISRQEAVSMIPPLLLDVEPHHKVLDTCAAPGSKTAQLIESLHSTSDEPTGFVIANDADARRSHMLVHQLKRLNSPNLLVVNHDAQFFPRIQIENNGKKSFVLFDRILCDVPCSGDGTMRKNINVWKDWNTQGGLGLHTVQYNILTRGLKLLKKGGRLVYSTCSLNPVENEAVVAQALRQWGDKIKLVDCSDRLPGLIREKGVSDWLVYDRNMDLKTKENRGDIKESCFPPTKEEAENFHLDRCIRVYQHFQNTGGFFIAVFEKNGETQKDAVVDEPPKEEPNSAIVKKMKTDSGDVVVTKKEKLPRDANEEPFIFIPSVHPELEKCWKFYGVDDKFDKNNCLVRNATGDPTRVVYTVSKSLKNIIESNEDRMKFIYAGVKLFVAQRSDIECPWRVQSESIPIMKHHMNSARVVECTEDALKVLLTHAFPTFDDFKDESLVSKLKELKTGCIFVSIKRNDPLKEDLFLPVWNGSKCANLMVAKDDTHELLYRIFGIETTRNEQKKPQQQDEKKEEGKMTENKI